MPDPVRVNHLDQWFIDLLKRLNRQQKIMRNTIYIWIKRLCKI